MSEFRSKSYGDGRNTQIQIQIQQNNHNNNNQNKQQLEKSYSYAGTRPGFDYSGHENGPKLKKNGSNKNNWMVLSDPELQRKKRVATYKAYTVEGKVKGGFKKGFRWIKDRYNLVLHGWKSP